MRKFFGIVAAAVLIALLLLLPAVLAGAAPTSIPHEDPDKAQSTFQPRSILGAYSTIFSFITAGKFIKADDLLAEMKTIEYKFPPGIYSTLVAYSDKIDEVSTKLSEIDDLLEDAEDLIDYNFLAEAENKLADINGHLEALDITMPELQYVTDSLKDQLSSFVMDSALFVSVYNEYMTIIDNVGLLRTDYEDLHQALASKVESVGLGTTLTLHLSSYEARLGEQITISGRLLLSSTSTPLPDQEVVLFGRLPPHIETLVQSVKVQTDADGNYEGNLRVPYAYTSAIIAGASFSPKSSYDQANYKACYNAAEVSLQYYNTELEVTSYPRELLVGTSYMIAGNVSGEGTQRPGRTVQFWLNNDLVGEGLTDDDGRFDLPLYPLGHLGLGVYGLRVVVLPDDNGISAETFKSFVVELVRAFPEVEIDVPGYLISPMSGSLSGTVSFDQEPVTNAGVSVTFCGKMYEAITDSQGDFSLTLELPVSYISIGSQNLAVDVQPSDSWLGSITVQSGVVVVSPLNIGFFSATLIAAGVVVHRWRRRRSSDDAVELSFDAEAATADFQGGLSEYGEGVLAAYFEAAEVIRELTGVNLGPNVTLREYLREVKPEPERIREIFAELTHLAELTLYSSKPNSTDAGKANGLLKELKRRLISEPT